ncbi:MAG: site-2 protease family protein [Methanomassiliicoccaceae archaeon]|nr:site-2 protease family protein [Methanomassiliicoccaceae archaeon]
MELTYIILIILTIIYIPIYIWVWRSPKAAKYGLAKYGPCVMIKTKYGTALMERLSRYRRFWRFFGTLSLIISAVLMVFILIIIAVGVSNLHSSLTAPGLGVEYALAIPGINPLLPFWYGVLGLIVAMVVHELAHGMQTRANDMQVDSTGVLYAVVPLGAFVEPNEEEVTKSSRRAKLDLYSAGISTNFIAAAVTFFIFAFLMLGNISSDYGNNAAVYQITSDSPAFDSGIPSGAIITSVNGEPYSYSTDYTQTYSWEPGDVVPITYLTQDGLQAPIDLQWGLFIESVSAGSPGELGGLQAKTFITSITIDSINNGEPTPIYSYNEFLDFMQKTAPGEKAVIECMTAGGADSTTYIVDLTLGSNGSIGYIGVVTSTSGMRFTTPNIMLDTGRNPIYGSGSITSAATSMMSYISGPFNGFSPIPQSVHWWYDVPLGGAFWTLISIFYWIFWLNIMLGVSNAIPAYPFDGGFIFLGGLNGLLEKLGMKNESRREKIASSATSYLSIIMIFLLILVIAAVVF